MDNFKELHTFSDEFVLGKDLKISLLPTGDVKEIIRNGVMYTGFVADCANGAIGGIYIREYDNGVITRVFRLNGKGLSNFGVCDKGAVYEGRAGETDYRLTLRCDDYAWYYTLYTSGDKEIDVLCTQDIGVGDKGFVRNNELYSAQYLGHTVKDDVYGFVISSRQNMGGRHPVLTAGTLGIKATGYSTDGLQFFGSEYRVTNKPALIDKQLPCYVHQYEMPFIALSTEKFVPGKERTFAFYFKTCDDLPVAAEGGMPSGIEKDYAALEDFECKTHKPVKYSDEIGDVLISENFTEEETAALYPVKTEEEREKGKLYSFFTEDGAYVATLDKEGAVQRPHGHISISGFDPDSLPENVMSNTSYMYGMICSQTIIGNTSFHKLFSVSRGFLDTQWTEGVRVYVKLDGKYRRLGTAGLFEIGLNYCRYLYKLPGDVVEIRVFNSFDKPFINVEVTSLNKKQYDFMLTMQCVMGEDAGKILLSREGNVLRFKPASGPATSFCPELNYEAVFDRDIIQGDDSIFFADGKSRNETLLSVKLSGDSFRMAIAGDEKKSAKAEFADFAKEKELFFEFYDRLLLKAHISPNDEYTSKLNLILRWYAHDCLVHYASPHGLEQTGGAAWGTRDVCQGPVEFFLTFGHFPTVKKILARVFRYQNAEGEWPQWFMFDEYPFAADDCHGDIVFWPLKALADYLAATHDYGFLSENIELKQGGVLPLSRLVEKSLHSIENRFIGDSGLITYAGGDWDDTLQPVNAFLKQNLISSWTMALAYQTLTSLASTLPDESLKNKCSDFAKRIKNSFDKDLVKDGVIAGFGYMDEQNVRCMLHPLDETSGIHLRLLPLTRSIIARMADKNLADKNVQLIDEHLRCPDGVRLMDRPARYEGGVSKIFVRAEQAANVGREISLQYVHAHIRYIEAMTVLGRSEDALWGLMAVNPINIKETVRNAMPRQSNCYSSSSEGLFNDRYEYRKNFDKLRDGSVPVRSGWRVYSSGGGIYLARLFADVLGVKILKDKLVLDPVLPADKFDGHEIGFTAKGKNITVKFVKGNERKAIYNGITLSPSRDNPYREGGIAIPFDEMKTTDNEIIFMIK